MHLMTLNDCYLMADSCMLKIEVPSVNHLQEAELCMLTPPKYVLKYRNPTLDLKEFSCVENMYIFLKAYEEEFKRTNSAVYLKRRQQWLNEYKDLLTNELGEMNASKIIDNHNYIDTETF